MQQRGRKSTAALSVVVSNIDGRPKAPADLTSDQAEVWERVVQGEPADQFRTAALQQLLKEFCRHTDTAHRLSEQVDRAMEGTYLSMSELDTLLRMRDRETKALADKATKLRLTNQARYTPQAAATAAKKAGGETKPWQMTG